MFGKEIQFKYKWRAYQDRVLKEIESHLSDNKLHIIAPPGSGKTVLGLEVVRRLNKNTLILSPTITIRNQWIDRFVELFSENRFSDYSFSLINPKFITSATYQGFHCALSKEKSKAEETDDLMQNEEKDIDSDFDLIETLTKQNIKVIVLDEAHHLKTEWWKSIIKVTKALKDITIISLTATPPYDSTAQEWQRYMELCGPVDAEISVPELVKEKNLCPHQDLIYFSEPSEEEHDDIYQFYNTIDQILSSIIDAPALETIIANHPAVLSPDSCSDLIYENIEYFASLVIFLYHKGNDSYKVLQKEMGLSAKEIPSLSGEWVEILLSNIIFKDSELKDQKEIKAIKKELRDYSAIENKRVVIRMKQRFNKMISSSISKFRSIQEIVNLEYETMQDDLRLVVLSDYVRRDALSSKNVIDKFGVIPIFKYLIESATSGGFDCSEKIAVLSGSLCIIPDALRDSFIALGSNYGLLTKEIQFKTLESKSNYSEIHLPSAKKNLTVSIVTDLLSEGSVNIVVGTKSLLGEGWDCQAINSLIMATFVGSYMLSNQIRGRAIRSQRDNTRKTSNIWHLMCLDTENKYNNYDKDLLDLRFKCFTGLDAESNTISNGMERLRLRDFTFNKLNVDNLNQQMKQQAQDRTALYDRWFKVIATERQGRMIKQIRTRGNNLNRSYVFKNTLKYMFLQGIAASFLFVLELYSSVLKSLIRKADLSLTDLSTIAFLLGIVFILSTLPSTFKAVILFFRHGSVSKSFQQIGLTVLNTLIDLGLIDNPHKVKIRTGQYGSGEIDCRITNCSSYEQSLFLTALEEIVEQIKNPRYLVSRENKFIVRTRDFHSVPSLFAAKKEKAEVFYANWKKHMGSSKMYYTRNKKGREILVRARSNSLSSHFVKRTEIIDSWKC